jgi:hypothetical protein
VFDRIHSAGLSVKSASWGFHCSNFESNKFQPVFTEFYRIRPIFSKTGGIEQSVPRGKNVKNLLVAVELLHV